MNLWPGRTSVNIAVLTFLALLATSTKGVRVSEIRVPALVVSGTTVQLSCNYEQRRDRPDPVYSVKWYRGTEHFYEYIPKNDPPARVYPQPYINVDERRSNITSVVLTGLKKESSGTYRCEVLGDSPHFETDDDAQNMTVLEIPVWGPAIQGLTPGSRVLPGDMVEARCLVEASDPQVDISWLLNSQEMPSHARVTVISEGNMYGENIQASELKFEATEESFRRGALTLTCEAKLSDVFHKSTNVTLIHALQPQPAEFGWFSKGSSATSIKFMPAVMFLLHVSLL
ncbi:uncharacterized protein [Macrobrachium rosenbergii]|uniref:uncharacterized protein n=1 Tax=Macrobrachium rosenbergii TaxID=79674 RepID=UPI0034D6DAF1